MLISSSQRYLPYRYTFHQYEYSIATPRRCLTYFSTTALQRLSRVEKRRSDKSPVRTDIAVWCQAYQKRLEQAAQEIRQIKEAGEPEEADLGKGKVTMRETHQV